MKSKKAETGFDYKTIKTFEDACKKEGIDPNSVPDVSMIPENMRKALIAVYKLFIVFKAVNDGWIADFTSRNQLKYYPWLYVSSADSGFDFSNSGYGYDFTHASVGSRLCTDTSEKAIYIAETFKGLYADFFLNN